MKDLVIRISKRPWRVSYLTVTEAKKLLRWIKIGTDGKEVEPIGSHSMVVCLENDWGKEQKITMQNGMGMNAETIKYSLLLAKGYCKVFDGMKR